MKKQKRQKKIILYISIIIMLCILTVNTTISLADVGSFESYSSGGSSSSSYSGSSYGGSSYGGYSSGGYSDGNFSMVGIITFIVIVVIAVIINKYGKTNNGINNITPEDFNIDMQNKEQEIENNIKLIDPMFNKDEFYSWTRDLFVKLQTAWMERDWETIRVFETSQLFEQHKQQLQGYIDNKQINMMERICVLSTKLSDFRQDGDKDIVDVILKSQMVDYIVDADTKKLLKGDKDLVIHSTYKLTFIRKTGVKTKPGTSQVNTTNCPNCGAPTQITSAGKCEYCGSVITTGEYNWVLSSLQKINI